MGRADSCLLHDGCAGLQVTHALTRDCSEQAVCDLPPIWRAVLCSVVCSVHGRLIWRPRLVSSRLVSSPSRPSPSAP
jgi:hypothetical protein